MVFSGHATRGWKSSRASTCRGQAAQAAAAPCEPVLDHRPARIPNAAPRVPRAKGRQVSSRTQRGRWPLMCLLLHIDAGCHLLQHQPALGGQAAGAGQGAAAQYITGSGKTCWQRKFRQPAAGQRFSHRWCTALGLAHSVPQDSSSVLLLEGMVPAQSSRSLSCAESTLNG